MLLIKPVDIPFDDVSFCWNPFHPLRIWLFDCISIGSYSNLKLEEEIPPLCSIHFLLKTRNNILSSFYLRNFCRSSASPHLSLVSLFNQLKEASLTTSLLQWRDVPIGRKLQATNQQVCFPAYCPQTLKSSLPISPHSSCFPLSFGSVPIHSCINTKHSSDKRKHMFIQK